MASISRSIMSLPAAPWMSVPQHSAQCELDPLRLLSGRRPFRARASPNLRQSNAGAPQMSAAAFRPCIDIHEVGSLASIFLNGLAPGSHCS